MLLFCHKFLAKNLRVLVTESCEDLKTLTHRFAPFDWRWCMNKIQINQRVIFIGLMIFDEKQPFFTKNITNKRRNTLIINGFIHAPTPLEAYTGRKL